MRRYTLVYDSGCGPCTRFRRMVGFLDTRSRLDFVPLTEADRRGLLDTIRPGIRHGSFHLVSPAGRVSSGAEAVPGLIRLLPAGSILSGLMVTAPLGRYSIAFVYSIFSRLHDSGSCSYTASGEATNHQKGRKSQPATLIGVLPHQTDR